MFYGDTPQDTRPLFLSSWKKHLHNQRLTPLEKQLVDVIIDHPEYHALFDPIMPQLNQDYFPELGQTNPFLHMGLHLAIRDQVSTNRPIGIADCYKRLLIKHIDHLTVEHLLMEPLVEQLWQAQRNQGMFDEASYLKACYKLLIP